MLGGVVAPAYTMGVRPPGFEVFCRNALFCVHEVWQDFTLAHCGPVFTCPNYKFPQQQTKDGLVNLRFGMNGTSWLHENLTTACIDQRYFKIFNFAELTLLQSLINSERNNI